MSNSTKRPQGKQKTKTPKAKPSDVVLSVASPAATATKFILTQLPTLMRYNGDWLVHDATHYREMEDADVRARMYRFMVQAKTSKGESFQPDMKSVSYAMDALKARAFVARDTHVLPCWLKDADKLPPAEEIIAVKNGLLHLPTGRLLKHTPNFLTRNGLCFDYDAKATAPRWMQFLKEIWPAADEVHNAGLLQEIFGYLIVPWTNLQKIFLLIGPLRCGKGTIGRVLKGLIGLPNIVAPMLGRLAGTFGMESLIAKQVALVGDIHDSKKMDLGAVAGILKTISGEDVVTIPRKHKSDWIGILPSRFALFGNEMPAFPDSSTAFAKRLVPLRMHVSFEDNPDTELTDKLLLELPGILNWAIEGWKRLKQSRHFKLPEDSKAMIAEMIALGSRESTFLAEECVLDPKEVTPKAELYKAWCELCLARGDKGLASEYAFAAALTAAARGRIRSTRSRIEGKQEMCWVGVRLRDWLDDNPDETSTRH